MIYSDRAHDMPEDAVAWCAECGGWLWDTPDAGTADIELAEYCAELQGYVCGHCRDLWGSRGMPYCQCCEPPF